MCKLNLNVAKIMGLKPGKSSENLKTSKDIIKNWNGSTCNRRVSQS